MKIAVCQINSKYVHSSLAAWCLKAGCEEYAKIPCRVVEGTINEKPQAVVGRIVELNPDLLGFCCYIWNIDYVKAVAKEVKALLPECKIVFGGPEVSYNAEEVLEKCSFVDFLISGEGELPFARLAESFWGEIPKDLGICYRTSNETVISEPYISCAEPRAPYCKEYFDTLGGRMVYFETSRGCPYSCAFCLSGRCGGVRYFDIERVKKEILLLANSGAQTIKFVDRTFNANKKRANEIVRFICEEFGKSIPEGVCFHFEIAGDIADEEFISLLTSAPKGLFQLEIGMQSFNEETLAAINRKTNCLQLREKIKALTSAKNMHIHIDLIAGLPLEGLASFKESFNTAYSLDADMLQLGFLKLLHGADMREKTEAYPCEFSKAPPYEVLSTPWLSAEDISLLKAVEDLLDRTYNSGRFRLTLEYAVGLFDSPFDFFSQVSKRLELAEKPSLDEFTEALYTALCGFEQIDREALRDALVCDRICATADGRLPEFLKVADPFLKTAKHFLEKNPTTKKDVGVRRSVALLYGEKSVVWCDHTEADKISGRFGFNQIPFDDVVKFND